MDIFSGSLQTLIINKSKLSHTKKDDYQFNINIRGNHLFIKEIPGFSLSKLGEAPYSGESKQSDKEVEKVKKLLNNLSPEERQKIIETYGNK